MTQAAELINQIGQLADAALQQLNKFLSGYLKLLTCKQFDDDDFLKVEKILKTEIIKNYEVKAFENEKNFDFFKHNFLYVY